jgi:NDP-sugar pyrophosphorylase family protein
MLYHRKNLFLGQYPIRPRGDDTSEARPCAAVSMGDIFFHYMNDIEKLGEEAYGLGFVPSRYLKPGEDEYRIRDQQLADGLRGLGRKPSSYRRLKPYEIEALVKNSNTCRDWGLIRVTDPFVPELVKDCELAGLVRIGRLDRAILEHHDLRTPVGITRSRVIACDIGDDCAIHDCAYVAHYIIGDGCILLSNDEIHASNHAKFGEGLVMEGESESVRVELDLMNEAGGRSVLPFEEMICADAYLWARRREDGELMAAFLAMTEAMRDPRRGRYGSIGRHSVLKSNRIMKDVAVGECAYIKGANKLKNLTIRSSEAERTQIGEGVELVNGIVGYGCKVFYGCKAVRFVMGSNSSLKYGARLIHSVLGDNSTVSCCEMLNNLIFPAHEQHHNTSFLIAALVRGQSNMAAGATIGSNHNSRAPDGEIEAGRGFWPGLATSVKHSSRFASYCLLAKGDFRCELDIRLPFCLVDDDRTRDRLVLVPAYWWTHNLYALLRNESKFRARDRRAVKVQEVELSPFAPDTAEEIIAAIGELERALGEGSPDAGGEDPEYLPVPAGTYENSGRPAAIRRPGRALAAYREMLLWYAGNALLERLESLPPEAALRDAVAAMDGPRVWAWENLGGQLAPLAEVDELVARARARGIPDWRAMHAEYARLAAAYPEQKARHALACLRWLEEGAARSPAGAALRPAAEVAAGALAALGELGGRVAAQVRETRAKDYANAFRRATFRSEAEMRAVSGEVDGNPFVRRTAEDMARLAERARAIAERLA